MAVMSSMIRLPALGLGIASVLLAASPVLAVVNEQELPPVVSTEPAVWPWLVAAVVALAIGATVMQTFKKGVVTKRRVESDDAWAKTENELAPRAQTHARLPTRDVEAAAQRRARPTTEKPAAVGPAFGRRSA
jgi:hypothetical protein